MAMGLAVGAGYVLGRTKKAKLAFGLTTLVLGRKLAPDGASVASFLGQHLNNSPQLKEIREQLRTDLRGVGSAAAGALVDRRLEAVADRLHDRTLDVQDRLAGLTGRDDKPGAADEDEGDESDGRPARKRPTARTTNRRTTASTAKSRGTNKSGSRKTADGDTGSDADKPQARRTTAKRSTSRGRGGDEDA
ncbi:DNA primase [Streptomyces sp. NPDC001272]